MNHNATPTGAAAPSQNATPHYFWCRSRKAGRIDNDMLICDCNAARNAATGGGSGTPSPNGGSHE